MILKDIVQLTWGLGVPAILGIGLCWTAYKARKITKEVMEREK